MNNNVIGPSDMNNGDFSFNNSNITGSKNNKKGSNKVFIVILVLILMAATGFGGWKLGTMYANKEDNKTNEISKDDENTEKNEIEVEEPKTDPYTIPRNEKYTFYKGISTDIDLNGHSIQVLNYFYLDKEVLISDETEQNVTRYVLRRDVFVEDNKVLDASIVTVLEDDNANDAIKYLEITDDDYYKFNDTANGNEYLVLYLTSSDNLIKDNELITRYSPEVEFAYILDDNGKLLKKIFYDDDFYDLIGIFVNKNDVGDRNYSKASDVYSDDMLDSYEFATDYILYHNGVIDFHESFIYYVTGDCARYDEFKLSITDGVVSDVKVKSYSDKYIDGAGGC